MKINEMADNRKRALDDVGDQQKALLTHIMKCILYREKKEWLPDWYKTVGNICSRLNNLILKGGSKLKEKDYINELLSFDDISDCQRKIDMFYFRDILTLHEYPSFIDRPDNAETLFRIYSEFVKMVSKIFATKNNYDNKYFAKLFEDYFKSEISKIDEDLTNSKLFDLLW